MGTLCSALCCGCCPTDRKARKNLKKQNLSILKDIAVQQMPKNPLTVKSIELSDIYNLPTNTLRDESDVLKMLGYQLGPKIDFGGFASIYEVVHLEKGLRVALKKIRVPNADKTKSQSKRLSLLTDIKNELYILQKTDHPNVVKMIQHFIIVENNYRMIFYILMQLATGGNLGHKLDESGPFSEKVCKRLFAQILNGMVYMHSMGFAHRDLKLSNILLDEAQDILISDFGLSRLVWREDNQDVILSRTFCGTPPYMAPEVLEIPQKQNRFLEDIEYNAFYADVWSLGIILFKLFNKRYPFSFNRGSAKAVIKMKAKKFKFGPPAKDEPTEQMKDIINQILEPQPNYRIKLNQLKDHPWIRQQFLSVEEKNKKRSETKS